MIRSFDSAEEMFEHIERQNDFAKENTEKWQYDLKPGDCFVYYHRDIKIYGEVIESVYTEDRELMKSRPELKLTRCFSVLCPEGEIGTIYACSVAETITREELNKAREQIQSIITE